MNSSKPSGPGGESPSAGSHSARRQISVEDILRDLRAGLRTKGFLDKYGFSKGEFEHVLKRLIRDGLFSKDEFREWKSNRPEHTERFEETTTVKKAGERKRTTPADRGIPGSVETYVIHEPEKNSTWALDLFRTKRERMHGVTFKANLQGKKYAFTVEQLLFRGSVKLLQGVRVSGMDARKKREQAIDYISEHGWAAFLESRAVAANLGEDPSQLETKARLVLLKCRNETYVAALHTPVPAVNFYVGSSLDNLRSRLAKAIDFSNLDI